jgi:hypothetical protein
MMHDDKRSRLIAKLIADTYAGRLKWELDQEPDPDAKHKDAMVSAVYKLNLGEVEFHIRQFTFRNSTGTTPPNLNNLARLMQATPKRYLDGPPAWETRTQMDILDASSGKVNEVITDAGRFPTLSNLFDAASRSVSNVSAFIDNYLKNDVNNAG